MILSLGGAKGGAIEGQAILQGGGHAIRLIFLARREGNQVVERSCFHRP